MKKLIKYAISLLTMTSLLMGAPKKDIVDTAVEAGSFKTLVTAVKAAGLVDTLKGDDLLQCLLLQTKPLPSYPAVLSNPFSNPRIKINLLES